MAKGGGTVCVLGVGEGAVFYAVKSVCKILGQLR